MVEEDEPWVYRSVETSKSIAQARVKLTNMLQAKKW